MKRIIATIVFILCSIALYSQNKSIDIARIEYRKGNYKDAVGLFNGAIATVTDAYTKDLLTKEKEKSSKCWECLEKADTYYRQSNFSNALRLYITISSINESDSYAKNQINRCRYNIEQAKILTNERKKINNLLCELIKTNDIYKLKKFVNDYPTHTSALSLKEILKYYDNPSIIDKEKVRTKEDYYIKFGDFYFDNNKTTAAWFYEKAATCGSLSGFYKLANSLPTENNRRRQRLLVFAAANGMAEAQKQLKSKYPKLLYDTSIPKTLYKHMELANKGNIYSAVYVQKNKYNIGLPDLYLLDDNARYTNTIDYFQYDLGMMYIEGNCVNKNADKGILYLYAAASKGNHSAQYALAQLFIKNEKYYNAFMLCAAINGNADAIKKMKFNNYNNTLQYAKSYVDFLMHKECDIFYARLFITYNASTYKIEDTDSELITLACYKYLSRKQYKAAIKLVKIKTVWDKETISRIQNIIGHSKNKYHKKILKQLTKVITQENINKPDVFPSLIKDNFCTNPHAAKEIPVKDYLLNTVN